MTNIDNTKIPTDETTSSKVNLTDVGTGILKPVSGDEVPATESDEDRKGRLLAESIAGNNAGTRHVEKMPEPGTKIPETE